MATADVTSWWCTSRAVMTNMKTGATVNFSPPTPTGTLFGAWVSEVNPPDTDQADGYTRFNTAIGGSIQIARTYDFGAGVVANLGQAGIGVIPQIASWNAQSPSALANVTSGASDSAINTVLAYITAHARGLTTWITMDHEFDSKINKGTYTYAEFSPAFLHFANLVAAHGDPNIRLCLIFVGASFSTRFAAYYPTLNSCGITDIGTDAYQGYLGGSDPTDQSAQNLMESMYDLIIANSLKWLVPETGFDASGNATQNATYVTSLSWCSGKADAVCWFNGSGSLGNTDLTHNPAACAAMGTLV